MLTNAREFSPYILQTVNYLGGAALKLIPLLILAVFLAELSRLKFGKEKLRRIFSGIRPWGGRLRAAALGAALPFCECGAFPVMLGLLRAGVSTGTALTFFLISPVVSVPAFLMLTGFFGPGVSLLYLAVTFLCGMGAALLLEAGEKKQGIFKEGFRHNSDSACNSCQTTASPADKETSGPCSEAAAGCCAEDTPALALKEGDGLIILLRVSWLNSWKTVKRMLPYAFAALILASLMRTFIPAELMERALAAGAPYNVIIAALAGIPLYAGDCTMIALVVPFITTTGAVGPGIAFIIAGAGTSINGIIFMSSIFRRRFLVKYIAPVFLIALAAGYTLSVVENIIN